MAAKGAAISEYREAVDPRFFSACTFAVSNMPSSCAMEVLSEIGDPVEVDVVDGRALEAAPS
jgi:hypothetical protein